jgi:hypothetical protein
VGLEELMTDMEWLQRNIDEGGSIHVEPYFKDSKKCWVEVLTPQTCNRLWIAKAEHFVNAIADIRGQINEEI